MSMTKLVKQVSFVFGVVGLVLVFSTTKSHAQAPDHLKCYKMKDLKTFKSAQADLDALAAEFGMPESCQIKGRAKEFCVPVTKTVTSIVPGPTQAVNGEFLNADHLCYKIKCPKVEIPAREVSDQFGTRMIEKFKASKLCTPAFTDGLPIEPQCGNGTIEPGENCEDDADCGAGESCNTSCLCMDSQCPDTMLLTRYDGVGTLTTGTENDSGWTGISHNNEVGDLAPLHLRLGSVTGSGPAACGVATITGVDPSSRHCRCANDRRQVCDEPMQIDDDDCGGNQCMCFWNPPVPTHSLGFPTCSVSFLTEDISGTFNVDTGEAEIIVALEQGGNNAEANLKPCPTCDGDVTMNDGVRDGTCNGGPQDGLSCDAMSLDATFPAPAGNGAYSLDCGPNAAQLSGGMRVEMRLRTGASTLPPTFPCGPGNANLCHCGRCDGDTQQTCTSNADCGSVGPCGVSSITNPAPNACTDEVCTDVGAGQGVCLAGPTLSMCDGVIRADGSGFITCSDNADCDVGVIGVPAGNCTIVQNRDCYPDTINVNGTASVSDPFFASATCVSPGFADVANIVAGFPGPVVYQLQTANQLVCAGDPGSNYPSCP